MLDRLLYAIFRNFLFSDTQCRGFSLENRAQDLQERKRNWICVSDVQSDNFELMPKMRQESIKNFLNETCQMLF